ncbi:hypothetical protein PG995_004590 [Apiospora arundinis]
MQRRSKLPWLDIAGMPRDEMIELVKVVAGMHSVTVQGQSIGLSCISQNQDNSVRESWVSMRYATTHQYQQERAGML